MIQIDEQEESILSNREMFIKANDLCMEQSQYLQQKDFFNRIVGISKCHQDALSLRTQCLLDIDKQKEALKEIKLQQHTVEALKKQVETLCKLDRQQEIIEMMNRFIQIDPRSRYALNKTVLILFNLNRYQQIIQLTDRIIELGIQSKNILKNYVRKLCRQKKYDEILEIPEKIFQTTSTEIIQRIVIRIIVKTLHQFFRYQEIFLIAEKILKINPQLSKLLQTIMDTLFKSGQFADIKLIIEKILSIDLTLEELVHLFVEILSRVNRYNELIELAEIIIQTSTSLDRIIDKIFYELCLQIRNEEIHQLLFKLSLSPYNVSLKKFIRNIFFKSSNLLSIELSNQLLQMGNQFVDLLRENKRCQAIIQFADKLIYESIDPSLIQLFSSISIKVVIVVAYSLCCLNKYQEIIKIIDKILQVNLRFTIVIVLIGIYHIDNQKAQALCDKSREQEIIYIVLKLKEDPSLIKLSVKMLCRLKKFLLMLTIGEKILEIDPEYIIGIYVKIEALQQLEKYQEVKLMANEILLTDPENTYILKYKVEALYKLGEIKEAYILSKKTNQNYIRANYLQKFFKYKGAFFEIDQHKQQDQDKIYTGQIESFKRALKRDINQ